MAHVKRVGPGSAFKVGLVLYGILGLIVGVLIMLISLAGLSMGRSESMSFAAPVMGVAAIIVCPILYGIFGGIFAAIGALLYNLAAGWVGGLEVDIS
jgi:hypothetical protein